MRDDNIRRYLAECDVQLLGDPVHYPDNVVGIVTPIAGEPHEFYVTLAYGTFQQAMFALLSDIRDAQRRARDTHVTA